MAEAVVSTKWRSTRVSKYAAPIPAAQLATGGRFQPSRSASVTRSGTSARTVCTIRILPSVGAGAAAPSPSDRREIPAQLLVHEHACGDGRVSAGEHIHELSLPQR